MTSRRAFLSWAAASVPALAAALPQAGGGGPLRWQVTAPPKPKGDQEPSYENWFVRELAFDPSGTKLLTRTNQEAACWDALTGARLHTFKAAVRITPRKPPEKDSVDIQQATCISPCGRFVALVNNDGKAVSLFHAATGGEIGTYRPPKGDGHYIATASPTAMVTLVMPMWPPPRGLW